MRIVQPRHRRIAAPVVALGVMMAGCSSSSFSTSSISSLLGSSPATSGSASTDPVTDFECPGVAVRAGAATLAVSANPSDQSALNMRYQVTIGQTARECRLAGTTVTMRVGVQGRVIVGPAGGPGQIDVPLRFAVLEEGPEPKTIMTKLQRVMVNIAPADTNVLFTHVEEELSFPMPRAGLIDNYVVYVGFDPLGAREPVRKRPERRPAKPRGTS